MQPNSEPSDRRRLCAEHPERAAAIECALCGDFACSDCTADGARGATSCTRCRDRGRTTYPLPWLRSLSPLAWLATTRAVLGNTRTLFGRFPQGSAWRAYAYALGWIVPLLLCKLPFIYFPHPLPAGSAGAVDYLRFHAKAYVAVVIITTLGHALGVICNGLMYYLALRMLGARVTFAGALSVVSYAFAFSALATVASAVVPNDWQYAPINGLITPFAFVALLFTCWAWGLAAQTRFELTQARALVASAAAFGLPLAAASGLSRLRDALAH